jgi:anion-transporting  ArsA/GET3 family ATPase
MKDKLQAIEWLMQQTYDEYDWNDEMLKSICMVMNDTQTMFSDDDLFGIHLCSTAYCGTDWRKALAAHKEDLEE